MVTGPEEEVSTEGAATARELDAALLPLDWSAHPPDARRDRVHVPSGELARLTMGPRGAERVMLVPGMTGSKEDFALMMPLFAEAGYRVESYDLAGQYESASAGPENLDPPSRRYTLELFVDDLYAVLTSDETPVHLLGYSFAGTVAAAVTAAHPSLVRTLTLLSTPPITGQSLRGFKKIGRLSDFVPARALRYPFVAALRHNVHGAPADRAAFVRERFDFTRLTSVGDILSLMKQTPDFSAQLRASGIPMLVAAGTGDVWRDSAHRAFAERLGAQVRIFDTGHAPCETTPHQLTEAMLALMSSTDSGRA